MALLNLFFCVWLLAAVISHLLYYFTKPKQVQPKPQQQPIQYTPQPQPIVVAVTHSQPEPEYTPEVYIPLRPKQGVMIETQPQVFEFEI